MTIEEQIQEAILLTEESNLRTEKLEIIVEQLVNHITLLTEYNRYT